MLLEDIKTKWLSQLISTEGVVILHDSLIFFQWLIWDKIVLNQLHTGLVRVLPLVCWGIKQKLFNINYNTNRPSHTMPCELKSQQLNMNGASISNHFHISQGQKGTSTTNITLKQEWTQTSTGPLSLMAWTKQNTTCHILIQVQR